MSGDASQSGFVSNEVFTEQISEFFRSSFFIPATGNLLYIVSNGKSLTFLRRVKKNDFSKGFKGHIGIPRSDFVSPYLMVFIFSYFCKTSTSHAGILRLHNSYKKNSFH